MILTIEFWISVLLADHNQTWSLFLVFSVEKNPIVQPGANVTPAASLPDLCRWIYHLGYFREFQVLSIEADRQDGLW